MYICIQQGKYGYDYFVSRCAHSLYCSEATWRCFMKCFSNLPGSFNDTFLSTRCLCSEEVLYTILQRPVSVQAFCFAFCMISSKKKQRLLLPQASTENIHVSTSSAFHTYFSLTLSLTLKLSLSFSQSVSLWPSLSAPCVIIECYSHIPWKPPDFSVGSLSMFLSKVSSLCTMKWMPCSSDIGMLDGYEVISFSLVVLCVCVCVRFPSPLIEILPVHWSVHFTVQQSSPLAALCTLKGLNTTVQ